MRQELSSKVHIALTCFCLFVVSLFLTAYSAKNPTIARFGSSVVINAVAPVTQVFEFVRGSCVEIWSSYIGVVRAARDNQILRARIGELENRLALSSEVESENARLRDLLNYSRQQKLHGVTAAVIGGDPTGWVKGVVVDKGSTHGIKPGMAVIHPAGVVGQVVSVSATGAKVLLVSDHSSGVDVLMHEGRARGVVEGAGERVCELKFVTKDVDVRVGDTVITSGMDGVYPKGILVGRVSEIGRSVAGLFQPIEVRPAVDFSRLEEVLIVSSAVVEGEVASW